MNSIRNISGILGSQRIKEEYPDYLKDESRYGDGYADSLYFPRNANEVCEILRFANDREIPVTISGGRTGIVGGAIPQGGILISLEYMNRFLGLKEDNSTSWCIASVEAGMLLKDFIRKIEEYTSRYFYPVDPTEDTAQIGGIVATNASGARSFKYGATRRYVQGIKVALASGELLHIQRGGYFAKEDNTLEGPSLIKVPEYQMPLIKNTAGYYAKPGMDLIDLFIGSEGTLGVICEIELELVLKAEGLLTVMAFFPSEEGAIRFVRDARGDFNKDQKQIIDPMSLEYFDSKSLNLLMREGSTSSDIPPIPDNAKAAILFEQEYSEEDLEDIYLGWDELLENYGSSMEETWGGLDERNLERIKKVRHALPETVNSIISNRKREHPEIHKMGTDMAVPNEYLEDMVAFYKKRCQEERLEYVIFGHVGDNHLHVNILPKAPGDMIKAKELYKEFARKVISFGGTVAAEHGIGKVKKDFLKLMYGAEGLREMAEVKRSLDPKSLLNRGNLLFSIACE